MNNPFIQVEPTINHDTCTSLRVITSEGDVIEAKKASEREPWLVSYPEGSFAYYGTLAGVRYQIKALIRAKEKADVENDY